MKRSTKISTVIILFFLIIAGIIMARHMIGLHFQKKPHQQGKLVMVVAGKVFDVCVDLRKHSKTFKKWISFELSDVGIRQIYMGPGIAHGFFVLSNFADLHYKVDKYYNPKDESGLIWNDSEINITKEYMLVYMILSAYGLLSVILAYFLPLHWSPLAGWAYMGISPTIYIAMKIHKKKIKSIT